MLTGESMADLEYHVNITAIWCFYMSCVFFIQTGN